VMSFLLEHFELTDCFAPEPDLESVLRRIYASPSGSPDELQGSTA